MGTAEEKFEGLTITLKKRKLNINEDNTESVRTIPDSDYLVLGHYDQIAVKYIDDWWEWRPDRTEALSLGDAFVDKYNIKAYFPEKERRERYEEKGFDYAIWKDTEQEYPFIVVSIINISEEYAKECLTDTANFCDVFSDTVLHCVRQSEIEKEWNQLHCAILPTIGFSDFLLIFKTADLKSTLNLLEQLKEELTGDAPCLSNAYTLIGFRDRGLDKLCKDAVGGIKLAIRFGLRDGVSAKQFHNYFKERFEEEQKSELADGIENKYRILGDADFLIVSNIELQQVLPFYFYRDKPGLFHPAHDLFKHYIRSMQSEVRVVSTNEEADLSHIEKIRKEKNVDTYTKDYQTVICELEKFMKENRLPERIVYGLQIVMKRFLQLVQSGHCFDMEDIIGGAFRNLINCVEQSMAIANGLEEDKKYEKMEDMMEALNMFRDMIGDYLADMQRSDSLFLEGRSLSHPSIGSATKLLFFYNGYIDSVKEVLCTEEEKDRYKFVVTSGGTDETRAIDLFSHLDPADERTCSIILMTVPEVSLYDVKSSLFRVLHEMFHFCGQRERKSRLGFVIDAVCSYTAVVFGEFMEKAQYEFYRSALPPLFSYIVLKEKVKAEIEKVIKNQTDNLKSKLKNLMKDRIIEKIPVGWEEKDYFGRTIYAALYTLIEEFFESAEADEGMEQQIYGSFLQYRYELAKQIEKILKENHILYSNVSLVRGNLEIMIKKGNQIACVEQDKEIIRYIIDLYLGREVREGGRNIVIAEEDAQFGLDEILLILQDLFKECYADYMAGKILNLRPEQFIFSFLAEAQNERNAFAANVVGQCRTIIDLRGLYGIEKFGEDIKGQVCGYAKEMKQRGIEYVEKDSLTDWLQQIINVGDGEERIKALAEPVIAYLGQCEKECEKEWNRRKVIDKLKAVQRLNVCSEMKTDDNIYSFLQSVADKWLGYAH